jgi:gamma-glutamylcyclotransferase (GGCT)/AIG2-like uncharacterized protein YtfP
MLHNVFVYGTLRDSRVRRDILGYNPNAFPGSLKGFHLSSIQLDGICYPILIEEIGCQEKVSGEYFEVDDKGLALLDLYESEAYRRKEVTLEEGIKAWVYYE